VEVTALTAASFSTKTIYDALNQKRGQVPNDAPAAIFCVLPEMWTKAVLPQDVVEFALFKVAHEFLATTRRINIVVIILESHIDMLHTRDGRGGALVIGGRVFWNMRPRIAINTPWSLFSDAWHALPARNLATADVNSLSHSLRCSEFFRWVDHLIPRALADYERGEEAKLEEVNSCRVSRRRQRSEKRKGEFKAVKFILVLPRKRAQHLSRMTVKHAQTASPPK
jgi:hypothetical protein